MVTAPGPWGTAAAFAAEVVIAFGMMSLVLVVSNTPRVARFTGLFAGMLLALYITFESPISGTSMNPARTVASALVTFKWNSLWIYFVAPPLGMLAAAEVFLVLRGRGAVGCAKMHHAENVPCLFCNYHKRRPAAAGEATVLGRDPDGHAVLFETAK